MKLVNAYSSGNRGSTLLLHQKTSSAHKV